MDADNIIPLLIGHIGESLVPQDTGIVDHNIDSAVGIDGGLDDRIPVLNRCLVADSFSTEFLNLLDDGIWVDKIIDDDRCAEFGKCQTIGPAKA